MSTQKSGDVYGLNGMKLLWLLLKQAGVLGEVLTYVKTALCCFLSPHNTADCRSVCDCFVKRHTRVHKINDFQTFLSAKVSQARGKIK